jgi:catechol 2,3-dioxygenase-like lactoylglutathione lyase family enzyme
MHPEGCSIYRSAEAFAVRYAVRRLDMRPYGRVIPPIIPNLKGDITMSNNIIKGLGYAHMAIAAKDFDKSLAFYKALGLTVYTQWGTGDTRIALLDMGDGTLVELFAKPALNTEKVAGLEDGNPFLHFAFSAQNVDEAYRIALEAGATSVKAPCEVPLDSHPLRLTLRVAFVKGPSGEELEFFKTVVKTI